MAIGIWRDGYETGPGILDEAQKPCFPHRFPAGDAGAGQRDRRGHAGDAQPGRDVGGLAGGAGPVCLQPLPRDDDHRHQHVRRPVLGEKGCGYGGAVQTAGGNFRPALQQLGRAALLLLLRPAYFRRLRLLHQRQLQLYRRRPDHHWQPGDVRPVGHHRHRRPPH